jgi:hypothetical protein
MNIEHFPLAPFVTRHGVDHGGYRNVSPHIQKVVWRLFDPGKPHFATWVWLYDIDHDWTKHMSTIHPERPEAISLYYAPLCGFSGLVKYPVTAHSPDVNKSGSYMTPLHAASVKGHSHVTSISLKDGADTNSHDDMDRAPLHRVS